MLTRSELSWSSWFTDSLATDDSKKTVFVCGIWKLSSNTFYISNQSCVGHFLDNNSYMYVPVSMWDAALYRYCFKDACLTCPNIIPELFTRNVLYSVRSVAPSVVAMYFRIDDELTCSPVPWVIHNPNHHIGHFFAISHYRGWKQHSEFCGV